MFAGISDRPVVGVYTTWQAEVRTMQAILRQETRSQFGCTGSRHGHCDKAPPRDRSRQSSAAIGTRRKPRGKAWPTQDSVAEEYQGGCGRDCNRSGRQRNQFLFAWKMRSLSARGLAQEVERSSKLSDDPVVTEYVNRVVRTEFGAQILMRSLAVHNQGD